MSANQILQYIYLGPNDCISYILLKCFLESQISILRRFIIPAVAASLFDASSRLCNNVAARDVLFHTCVAITSPDFNIR